MPPEIRQARPADAPVLHRFICELAQYEREPDAVEVTPDELRAQMNLNPPPFEALLAEVEGEAVGFALYCHNYSTWRGRRGLYLEDLYVPPRFRGNGIGRVLLETLAAIAVERGCARMEWAVLHWNEPAFRFYESIGARRMDDWVLCRITDEALERLAAPAAIQPKQVN